jgi:putative GTP pyrophosphokinase
MKLIDYIRKNYEYKLSEFERTKDEANFIIKSFLDKTEIKIHSIQSRIKDINSLIAKVETLEIEDSEFVFSEINDIVGLRIICLFLSDITEITALIKQNFEIISEDNKLENGDVSSFGYFSVHYLCRLPNTYKGPRYDDIKYNTFEIQVRTISMDAWANISHYLDYKSDVEIPKSLKKDFFALSGLFYVADTHFEMFFKNKKQQSVNASRDLAKNYNAEINYETVEAYIGRKFKKNKKTSAESISILTRSLVLNNYKTIKELDDKLNKGYDECPEIMNDEHWNQVGVVRTALYKLDPNWNESENELYHELKNNKHMKFKKSSNRNKGIS